MSRRSPGGKGESPAPTRRGFLVGAGGAIAGAGLAGGAEAATATTPVATRLEPFRGRHQAGIVTPQQAHSYFLAFDLSTAKRDEVAGLLRSWTEAAARMATG
ncbi:MAG TPA: Dyp-type peroxidase domain-containing protein, partial [Stellaceae bacterium]|nr:Dyp-type peroxidase domain-containing protein [Stellaceae bacterium]